MKILVIGGTGKTGKHLINQALEQGYIVTALVRRIDKLKISHPNLKPVQGNVLNPDSLQAACEDQEVVISALGHKKFFIRTSVLSEGTRNIIDAMYRSNTKRFLCITSLGINDSRYRLGLYYTLFVIPFIILFYFLDKEKQEKLIMKSTLDWTIIRPGQLTNGKKRTTYKHGPELGHYILTKMVSRADVAHFILSEVRENNYIKEIAGITY